MPLEIGSEVEGKVTGITNFGAFVELPEKEVGLVHISQISDSYVRDINQHLKIGDAIKVKILAQVKNGKYDLSIKQVGKALTAPAMPPALFHRPRPPRGEQHPPDSFEGKITEFLKRSEERQSDFKRNLESKQGVRKRPMKKKT